MATIEKFEDIISWKEARDLNKTIGELIDNGRFKNSYRLINQIEGSAGSIMDNIAEGFGRSGNREFIQFLEIAFASTCETQSQLYRVRYRNYITETQFYELYAIAEEIKRKIIALVNYLKRSPMKGVKYKEHGT